MPLRDMQCTECGHEAEIYYSSTREPKCPQCGGDELFPLPLSTSYGKTGCFPYTTTHLSGDGKPVVVESLGHLRRLEKHYGVMVHAFSNEPGNPDSPRDLPRQRPGGRDYEPREARSGSGRR